MTDQEKRIEEHIKDFYSVHSDPRKVNLDYAKKGYELAESELSSLRSELAEKEKWINVKDQLPEYYGDVLTINKSGFMHVVCFSSGNWLRKDNRSTTNHLEITHWMPLPKSPIKE